MQLKDLVPGDKAKVLALSKNDMHYRRKLLTMGLTPGTELTVVRMAPMGDPIEIKLRGFCMTLRKAEAEAMTIEVMA
jgi:ferrous iron transport protein A